MTSTDSPDTGDDPTEALTVDFAQTARTLFSAGGVDDTLSKVVDLAVASIEGCDFAGVFLLEQGGITTPAHTDPVAADLDALQQRNHEGPCVDAITQGVAVYAGNLDGDPRWPRFGPEAASRGVRSLLSLPVLVDATPGALNLYACYPEAFGVIDRARGLLLAVLAGLAFTTARAHENEERQNANLHAALATREMIGQAQGILMERERITADQAFDILRRASQHLNVRLNEVARTLVDTGERPDTGARGVS